MKTINQTVQKLALPPLLRKGLEATRVSNGDNQKYLVRSIWKDQTYEFEPWQFFILEVLPACDNYTKLLSVFKDRFGHLITEKEVNELFSLVVEKGLFDEQAISHPMLKSYKEIDTTFLVGKLSHKEPSEKDGTAENFKPASVSVEPKAKMNMEPNRNPESTPAVLEKEKYQSTFIFRNKFHEEGVNLNGSEGQGHLVRAMQKAKMAVSVDNERTSENREEQPQASLQMKNDKGNIHFKVESSGIKAAPSSPKRPNSDLKDIAGGSVKIIEKKPPSDNQETIKSNDSASVKGFKIFDPIWLIKILLPLLSPLRHAIYLIPLLLIAALFISTRHFSFLTEDFQWLLISTSFVKHALLSMITVNLSATLVTALIAYNFRVTVSAFCIVFYMYFFPRFMVRLENTQQLLRRERIWLHAALLLLRLGFFSIGILLWFKTRTEYELLSNFSLIIAMAGAISFCITVNPLIKSSGYQLIAAFINDPNLREKAFKALFNKFRGKVYKTTDNNVLVSYALVSSLYTLVMIAVMLYIFGSYLNVQLGAASVMLIVLLALILSWSMFKKFKEIDEAYERSVQFERWRKRILPEKSEDQIDEKPPSAVLKYIRRSVFPILLVVLFLPYTYEPGGNFNVLPNEQQTITTENAGIIETIYFDGGEILKKDTVIGQLSCSDYLAQVKIYAAKIAQQQAVLDDLKARPRPEEVLLAKTALDTQKTQAQFSKGKASRLQDLYNQGVVSLEDLEDARKKYEVDRNQIQEKLANLELVRAGATQEEISEAAAKLQSFKEERDYYQDKIEKSTFYMPFDGKLTTLNLKQRVGSYLNKGETLAVAEQTRQIKLEIEIPETDISYVKENSQVRCRFQVYNDEDFYGVVKTIDANVSKESYGKVIKVVTLMENKEEKLKSGMTGYAKIIGERMPLWKVLSLSLIRFIKVEVWSWLP